MQPNEAQERALQKKIKQLSAQQQTPELRPIEKLSPEDLKNLKQGSERQPGLSWRHIVVTGVVVLLGLLGIFVL